MKKYESYAASYPVSYYELGTIYSFYGKVSSTGMPATAEQIRKYSSVLQELESDESTFHGAHKDEPSAGQSRGPIGRYYAVVVDKVNAGANSYIVAMLCNKNNGRVEYYTREYAVNSSCFTDSKNWMQPSAHLNFSTGEKKGGITLPISGKKIGGITLVTDETKLPSSSVGGITVVQKRGDIITGA